MKPRRLFRSLLISLLVLSCFSFAIPIGAQRTTQPAQRSRARSTRDEALWQRALAIHRRAIVIDTHNDVTTPMTNDDYDLGGTPPTPYRTSIARMKQGGQTAEFFSLYIKPWYVAHGGAARRTLDMIDSVYRAVERHPNDLMFATTVDRHSPRQSAEQNCLSDGHRRRTRDREFAAGAARVLSPRRALHDADLEQHERLGRRGRAAKESTTASATLARKSCAR